MSTHKHSPELIASFIAGNLHRFTNMSVADKTCSAHDLQQALQRKDPRNTYEVSAADDGDMVVVNGGENTISFHNSERAPESTSINVDGYLDRLHGGESDNTRLGIVLLIVMALAVTLTFAISQVAM